MRLISTTRSQPSSSRSAQLRFGTFLSEHFGAAFAEQRQRREQAADEALAAWDTRERRDSAVVDTGAHAHGHATQDPASESGARPVPLPPEPQVLQPREPQAQSRQLPRRTEPTLRFARALAEPDETPGLPARELLRATARTWLVPVCVVALALFVALFWLALH